MNTPPVQRRKRPSVAPLVSVPAGPEPQAAPPGAFGQLLLQRGLVTAADLDFILSWQRSRSADWPVHRLASLLIKAGLLTVRQAADVLSEQRGVPVVTELPRSVPRWLQSLLPRDLLRQHEAVPLYVAGQTVVVAMVCPEQADAVQALRSHTSYKVQPVLALQIQIHRLLRSIYLSAAA
jgi:hypothetical protein